MSVGRLHSKKFYHVSPVAASIGVLIASLGISATAQTANANLSRVEVTGSSIKRIDGETSLPVQILTREDIVRTGATTTEELIKQLSSLSSGGSSTTVANASGYGGGNIATVSLRGLGGGRTLVLVNGRRVSVYGGGSAGDAGSSVDINSVPFAAIERIEVLKDGASAIYGSDAIAGVVNFILRKDFNGVEVSATLGQPTSGPGKDRKASIFAGMGSLEKEGYNITFGASVQKIDPIYGSDRSYANRLNIENQNDVLSSIAFPANVRVYSTGRFKNPVLPNCGPVSQVSPYSPTLCSFDNSPYVSIQPASERANILLNGRLALNGDAQVYFESSLTQNKITSTTQPVPMTYNAVTTATNAYAPAFQNLIAQYPGLAKYSGTFRSGGFILVPSSPYYPTDFAAANGMAGLPLALNYRDVSNGARNTLDVAESKRFLAGVKGSMGAWDLDAALLYTESKVHEDLLTGYAQYSKVLPIFNSGVINPFGETADKAALAAVQAAEFRDTSYSTQTSSTGLSLAGSRELFSMAAGPVSLALGTEYRREKFQYDPSVAIQTGDIAGLGGNAFPVAGARNVTSAYAEVSIPVAKKLDVDLAARYDNYEGVGSTVNPKASIRWQPYESVLLRSSVGRGFRAPSLTDLYTPQATSVTGNGTRDPIRCPDVKTGAPNDCNFQFTTVTGGNPDLKPEKSLSYTFGVLLEPVKNLSLGLDLFRVNLEDAIVVGGLSANYFLANADRAAQYAAFVQRGAPDGNASGVGPITSISQTNANLFKTEVSGVDVDFKYAFTVASGGKFGFRLSGTYLDKYDVQGPDGSYSSSLDRALNASGGVNLRWKHNASVTYAIDAWGVSLAQNYQKAYDDIVGNRAPAGTPTPTVDAYQTFDGQVTYTGIQSTKIAVGIKNLFDRNPPYTNVTSNFLGGYDVGYSDPRGRFAYVTVTSKFK